MRSLMVGAFATLCRVMVDAGHMTLPTEDTMRSCRFCRRGINLWRGTQFAAPDACRACTEKLPEWNAQVSLRNCTRI